jgi:hypothetical protein
MARASRVDPVNLPSLGTRGNSSISRTLSMMACVLMLARSRSTLSTTRYPAHPCEGGGAPRPSTGQLRPDSRIEASNIQPALRFKHQGLLHFVCFFGYEHGPNQPARSREQNELDSVLRTALTTARATPVRLGWLRWPIGRFLLIQMSDGSKSPPPRYSDGDGGA